MVFKYPQAFYGLFALLIPIIIHAINLNRYQRVEFSSIAFLQETKQSSKRKFRLRSLLVLFARCLAIISLVALLANPILPKDNVNQNILFLIDNSASMNDPNSQGFSNLSSVREHFLGLKTKPNVAYFKDIFVPNSSFSNVVIISDFQKGSSYDDIADYGGHVEFLQLENKNSNISVDSVWLASPLLSLNNSEISISINNHNTQLVSARLRLSINDQLVASRDFKVDKNQSIVLNEQLDLRDSLNYCEVEIEDASGYHYDNSFYFSIYNQSHIDAVVLSEGSHSRIAKVISSESFIRGHMYTSHNYDPEVLLESDVLYVEDFSLLAESQVDLVRDHLDLGGDAFICVDSSSVTSLSKLIDVSYYLEDSSVININKSSKLYKSVFTNQKTDFSLPRVYNGVSFSNADENLLRYENGRGFLSRYNLDKGNLYLLGSSLSDQSTNFHKHGVFVPTILNIAFSSSLNKIHYNYLSDDLASLDISNNDLSITVDTLRVKTSHYSINGRDMIQIPEEVDKPGNYAISNNRNETVGYLSINSQPGESITSYYTEDELLNLSKSGDATYQRITDSSELKSIDDMFEEVKSLWKYCLILILIFLLLETVLIRFLKIK